MSIGLYWEKLRCKHWRVPVISLHERYHNAFLYSDLMDTLIKGEVVSEAFGVMIKGALSAQARELVENNLNELVQFFKVLSEILEGCFYLFKSQPSFDSLRGFVLWTVLWWLQKTFFAIFFKLFALGIFQVDLQCPPISGCCTGSGRKKINDCYSTRSARILD